MEKDIQRNGAKSKLTIAIGAVVLSAGLASISGCGGSANDIKEEINKLENSLKADSEEIGSNAASKSLESVDSSKTSKANKSVTTSLDGVWGTSCQYDGDDLYELNIFAAKGTAFSMAYVSAFDSNCEDEKLAVAAASGYFEKGPEDSNGIANIDYHFEKFEIALLDERMVQVFNKNKYCGVNWRLASDVDDMTDVTGCPDFYEELGLDIVQVEGDTLYFGEDDDGRPSYIDYDEPFIRIEGK